MQTMKKVIDTIDIISVTSLLLHQFRLFRTNIRYIRFSSSYISNSKRHNGMIYLHEILNFSSSIHYLCHNNYMGKICSRDGL